MAAGVRLATTDDVVQATETLALAHHDYAWAVWAFPRTDRAALLRQLFKLDLIVAIDASTAWVTDRCSSVAIWSPPSSTTMAAPTIAAARDEQNALIGHDIARLRAADALTHDRHPPQPYWYLGTVGTRPDRSGHGGATAVIRPVLDHCDSEQITACLETSSDTNVRLYERMGFVDVFRTVTADGSLPLIVMHRRPR